VRVDIWSDIVCPWCYIGKRRFELALGDFEHAGEVEVVWRSFELDPNAPPRREGDYVGRIARKYGVPREQAEATIDRMVRLGDADGLELRFDILRAGNTFDAHRIVHLARERGVQHDVKERLFRATFSEGEPIGDPETLVRLAEAVGLDAGEARDVLATNRYAQEVRDDEREATELGITAVPFYVIDGKAGVPGAQEVETFVRVLERMWARRDAS
jgi:predicted DsbA family dithiol-disulfide isomerase